MRTDARSDSSGLCLVEYAPWGVIGMVLPATHSVPTMASNAINILAAGNTAVFSPHPSGVKVAARGLQKRKLIAYHRGTVTILDHGGLVAAACECYKTVKDIYAQARA